MKMEGGGNTQVDVLVTPVVGDSFPAATLGGRQLPDPERRAKEGLL